MLHRKKERIFTFSHKMIDREPHLPGRRLSHSQIGRRSKRNSPKPKAHVFGSHSLETGGYIHERPTLCAQAALLSAGLLLRRPDSGTGGTNWSCRNPRTSGAGGTDRPHGAGWYSRPGGRRRRDRRNRSGWTARGGWAAGTSGTDRPGRRDRPNRNSRRHWSDRRHWPNRRYCSVNICTTRKLP